MPYRNPSGRLYLTADKSTVVEEGNARAAFLLCGVSGVISDQDAEKYGLTGLSYVEPEVLPVEDRRLGDWSRWKL